MNTGHGTTRMNTDGHDWHGEASGFERRRDMSPKFHILLMLAMFAGVSVSGQTPQTPPTFRVEVNYVEIDARATDAQGNFVADLTENDFQILEDGAPQAIKVFTRVNLPIERQDAPLLDQRARQRLHEHALRQRELGRRARPFVAGFVLRGQRQRHLGAGLCQERRG